ncbi:calycin-like domain-containing protein [bacterium]|nr:calycin-like domain-containing protein [bacterium]
MGTEKKETLVTQGSQNENSWTVLTNKYVGALGIGSNAPAFINFGTPWVYAVSKIANCDGGVYGGMAFSSRPDAIKGRYKRTTGTEGEENAHIIAYLWKGTFTSNIAATGTVSKDDVDRVVMGKETGTASGTLIASCDYSFSSTANNDWEEIIVPLNYVQGQEETLPEKMNVIISSADYWTRSNIKAGNVLEVDDVDFVYYHALSDLQVDGVTVEGFNESQTNYTLDVPYEADKVTYTVKGRSAQAQETYNEESGVLTIVVTNEGETTTYTVQFDNSTATVTPYSNDLSVTINGECTPPQPTEIQLIDEKDGSTSLALNNFMLVSGEDAMPVGNIYLTNVQRSGENPMRLTTTQKIAIMPGDLPGIDFWLGPMLGDVPVELNAEVADGKMTATIDIDMQEALGQMIHVVFAPTLNVSTETNLNTEAGLYNLVVNRNFKKGWSTLCLPFGITPEQIGAEGAQAFTSESNNVLNFSKVENMEANTPYIVYFSTEKSDPMYFGVKVENTEAKSVNNSGNFTFKGNYTAGMNMDGLYGVATIDGEQKIVKGSTNSTLPATCAYFTNSGTMEDAYAIRLEGEEITGINAINNGVAEDGAVYNLQGVKVSDTSMKNLPAGLYIMNGKKFIIK